MRSASLSSVVASLLLLAALLPAQRRETASPPPSSEGKPAAAGRDPLARALARVQQRLARTQDVWQDHSAWENAWVAKTDHFAVRSTASYGFAHRLAVDLESMLGHFQSTLGMPVTPAAPISILVFPDITSYNQFGNQHGQEHSSFYGAFWAAQHPEQAVGAFQNPNRITLRMHITHAVFHRWLHEAFPGATPPLWIDEGLASYFALYWSYQYGLDELDRMRGENQLLPIRNLLGDALAQYGDRTHERLIQLGMLFYYLLRYNEATRTTQPGEQLARAPFRDYIVGLLRGDDVTSSPMHALTQQLDDLGKDFAAYAFPR